MLLKLVILDQVVSDLVPTVGGVFASDDDYLIAMQNDGISTPSGEWRNFFETLIGVFEDFFLTYRLTVMAYLALSALGLTVEPFGGGAVAVRETPALLGEVNAAALIRDILDELHDLGSS